MSDMPNAFQTVKTMKRYIKGILIEESIFGCQKIKESRSKFLQSLSHKGEASSRSISVVSTLCHTITQRHAVEMIAN